MAPSPIVLMVAAETIVCLTRGKAFPCPPMASLVTSGVAAVSIHTCRLQPRCRLRPRLPPTPSIPGCRFRPGRCPRPRLPPPSATAVSGQGTASDQEKYEIDLLPFGQNMEAQSATIECLPLLNYAG
ncbi:hypothetical protein E2562_007888 [Oryza meyeriana var. granulata]|uniref:Uncharacterized protein n=1 Tax=Oryza meyeriana var. granulata TaxID=110450 RepID=A0A6G1F5K0_9ORYZ|nr:hypothetical protein E2562_007888 [Oryza meyeriana var. granulata]